MTKAPQLSLKRTCSICGEERPLSAFMQLDDETGMQYSAVCSTCRSEGRDKINEVDDETRSRTGHQIDSKTKTHSDKEKKSTLKEIEEEYHEERKEDESINTNKQDVKQSKDQQAKKHHDGFLIGRRQSTENVAVKNWQQEAAKEESTIQTAQNQDASNRLQINEDEHKRTNINFSVTQHAPGTAQIRYQSAIFQQFKQRLGAVAPIGKSKAPAEQTANKEDTVTERIENTWGSKSKR